MTHGSGGPQGSPVALQDGINRAPAARGHRDVVRRPGVPSHRGYPMSSAIAAIAWILVATGAA